MPTELDKDIHRITDAVTAPGQMFELTEVTRRGVQMPAFKNAPPSVVHYFAHFCNEKKDDTFIVDGDVRMTFGEIWHAASHVAHGLATLHGIEKGDRVGLAARNSTNWIVAYMGILMAGGCATLLNGWWTGEELAYGIDLCECKLVLADPPRAARLDGVKHASKLVVFDHGKPSEGLAPVWAAGGTAMAMLGQIDPDDLATILYTSGSTGRPKGAYSDHLGVVSGTMNYVCQTAMILQLLTEKGDAPTVQPSALVAVPLFHVTGEVPLFLQSFAMGRKLVLMPKWDATEALRLLADEQITYFVGVPLMSYEIAVHPDREKYDLSQCKTFAGGGAARPIEHVKKIKDAFKDGFPALGYGLTETSPVVVASTSKTPYKEGFIGQPVIDTWVKTVDDDGKETPRGEPGEVLIKGPQVMQGYWHRPDETAATFTEDGWLKTGDVGLLDEEGFLKLVDRKKDMILVSGFNVYPNDVEDAVMRHAGIRECVAVGVPDERTGEAIKIFVSLNDATLDEAAIIAHCRENLTGYKIPKHVEIRDDLPKSTVGKLLRRVLRDEARGEAKA